MTGEYTFAYKNGMSTIDYLLASPADLNYLANFKILEFNEFSDHTPVFFSFLSHTSRCQNTPETSRRTEQKIIYDESKSAIFRSELMNSNEVLIQLTDSTDSRSVDCIVNSFTELMYAKAAYVFGKKR